MPQAAPLQPAPETPQVTAVFVVLVTVAVNVCDWLALTVADVGETEIVIGGGVVIVTEAAADFVLSACDVAVTITELGEGAEAGAVYTPPGVIVPQALPVQPAPDTLHVTAVLLVLMTAALNVCVAPTFSVTDGGDIETATGAGA